MFNSGYGSWEHFPAGHCWSLKIKTCSQRISGFLQKVERAGGCVGHSAAPSPQAEPCGSQLSLPAAPWLHRDNLGIFLPVISSSSTGCICPQEGPLP